MVSDKQHSAVLIARFMEKRLSNKQAEQLDNWLLASDKNMQLFELLTEERNTGWAKSWFTEAGVENRYLKNKKYSGWYKPRKKPKDYYTFSIIAAACAASLIMIILNDYMFKSPDPTPFAFKQKTINQVVDQLKNEYKISIHYNGHSDKQFTATIPADYSLVKTLDTLQQLLNVNIEVKGKEVMVTDK
ncbi:MAG: DUF4974 domain-containing protein [Chitinophagaceae bacterium]|nr:DUF4974 domain-containing protein [Chitinophagaceae bacterium]